MDDSNSSWLIKASKLPIAFAQVREDPCIDLEVLNDLPPCPQIAMVASGGCTAAYLAGKLPKSQILLVDSNPAQQNLTRLKLDLLQRQTPHYRHLLLGHAFLEPKTRKARLQTHLTNLGLAEDSLGPLDFVSEVGPDFAGRYERVFAELQRLLLIYGVNFEPVLDRKIASNSHTLGDCQTEIVLDKALASAMSLPKLVELFGEEATRNPADEFWRHFGKRIHHAFRTLPTENNPFLWQMLLGRYPIGNPAPWLDLPQSPLMPKIEWANTPMNHALANAQNAFDFLHLSNILDWLSPEIARETLACSSRALKKGGMVIVRQLNSTLDIPQLGEMFEWQTKKSGALHDKDRSFFYRALHVGKKR